MLHSSNTGSKNSQKEPKRHWRESETQSRELEKGINQKKTDFIHPVTH